MPLIDNKDHHIEIYEPYDEQDSLFYEKPKPSNYYTGKNNSMEMSKNGGSLKDFIGGMYGSTYK